MVGKKKPYFALKRPIGTEIPLSSRKHLRKITGEEAVLLYLEIHNKATTKDIAEYFDISPRQVSRYIRKIIPELLAKKEA